MDDATFETFGIVLDYVSNEIEKRLKKGLGDCEFGFRHMTNNGHGKLAERCNALFDDHIPSYIMAIVKRKNSNVIKEWHDVVFYEEKVIRKALIHIPYKKWSGCHEYCHCKRVAVEDEERKEFLRRGKNRK